LFRYFLQWVFSFPARWWSRELGSSRNPSPSVRRAVARERVWVIPSGDDRSSLARPSPRDGIVRHRDREQLPSPHEFPRTAPGIQVADLSTEPLCAASDEVTALDTGPPLRSGLPAPRRAWIAVSGSMSSPFGGRGSRTAVLARRGGVHGPSLGTGARFDHSRAGGGLPFEPVRVYLPSRPGASPGRNGASPTPTRRRTSVAGGSTACRGGLDRRPRSAMNGQLSVAGWCSTSTSTR